MKKLLVSLLMGCLVLGMVACGSNADSAPQDGGNDTVVETPVDTEPVATEPATEPVEQDTEVVEEPEAPVEDKVAYTYTDVSATMYAKKAVNVRDLPSTDGNVIEGLSFAEEVAVTGKCNETGWYRVSYGGETGYVSGSYLVSEKPVAQSVATAPAEPAPVEPEVVLEKSPYLLWDVPVYHAETDSMVYYYVPGHDMHHYYYYQYVCELLTQNNGRTGEYYSVSHPMGTFQEGEVFMAQVFVK